MERGQVRWCQFSSPDKQRPIIILTRDSSIRHLNTVTVVPVTSTIRGVASEVRLSIEDGLLTDCAANFHNIQTVSKNRLGSYITTLSPERMKEVERAIKFALGFEN